MSWMNMHTIRLAKEFDNLLTILISTWEGQRDYCYLKQLFAMELTGLVGEST